jgi:hypothetical protein
MTDRKSRLRLSKLEKLASTALKEREERENKAVKELPLHARRHATAVAAIVLSGQPKIEEPLIMAWPVLCSTMGLREWTIKFGLLSGSFL